MAKGGTRHDPDATLRYEYATEDRDGPIAEGVSRRGEPSMSADSAFVGPQHTYPPGVYP
jgi:hypothetical protein